MIGVEGLYGSHAWLGIPYAQPPVGELRWRAPRPLARWQDEREALAFGSPCVQYASPVGGVPGEPGEIVGSEDCLFLNVWAPPFAPDAVPTGDERLPVMLWIHGGGNSIGESGFYNGGNLATTENVVVVSINYRLGPFGWFRHPALRGADTTPADRSGNFGTLDHIRALEWVRDNISAFGGDPGNVTIFGESAGGTNVIALLVSPPAAGSFQRAIAQSGSTRSAAPSGGENFLTADPPGHANSSSEVLLRLLTHDRVRRDADGIRDYLAEMNAPTIERYLRSKRPDEILGRFEAWGESGMVRMPELFRDGYVLPGEPTLDRLAHAGSFHAVPVMLGTTRDENKLFMYLNDEWVWRVFGMIPHVYEPKLYDLTAEYLAKHWKATGADGPAAAITQTGYDDVYVYRFDWDEQPSLLGIDLGQVVGAAHGFEIPFVFGHFDLGDEGNILFTEDNRPGRQELAGKMMGYWAEFARTGNPARGGADHLRWEPWGNGSFLVLDTEAGGGLHMSRDTQTTRGLLADLAADERFTDRMQRCRVLRSLVLDTRSYSAADYVTWNDGACTDYPIDAFPWQ